MIRGCFRPALLSICVFVGVSTTALGHDEGHGDGFVTPDPALCQAEPRTLESVTSLAGTPAPVPMATPAAGEGTPANDELVAAITAAVEESVACFNAGDFLAQFAFYTDEAILGLMPPGLTSEDLAAFLDVDPEPLPEEARESVLVRDVMLQADGQVTAYVEIRNAEGTFTTFITLEQQGERYVIVSDIDLEAELATPAA